VRVRVKICGVTSRESVRAAVDAGADAVGFVFAESPRRIDVERALELSREIPPFVARVAVFRHPDPETVAEIVQRLCPDAVQSEPVDGLVRAKLLPVFHDDSDLVTRVESFGPSALLLEAAGRGGRGFAPNWERAATLAARYPLVLAGGLCAENVADAIRRVRPFAVDVSSGVESAPGIKDPYRIRSFVDAVRHASRRLDAEKR